MSHSQDDKRLKTKYKGSFLPMDSCVTFEVLQICKTMFRYVRLSKLWSIEIETIMIRIMSNICRMIRRNRKIIVYMENISCFLIGIMVGLLDFLLKNNISRLNFKTKHLSQLYIKLSMF